MAKELWRALVALVAAALAVARKALTAYRRHGHRSLQRRRLWLAPLLAVGLALSPVAPAKAAMTHRVGLHDLDEDRREPLVRLIRAAEADVAAALRTRLDGTLKIDFAGSDEAFRALVANAGADSRWSEPWISGLALLNDDHVLIRLDGPGLLHTSDTVRHEIAHIAVHALSHGRWLPRWYHEAVATYVAGEATSQRLLEGLSGGAAGSLETLDDLQADFSADRLRASRAYATAAGFLRFAVGRSGNTMALAELHERMHYGLDFEPAWIATFGLAPRELFVVYARLLESAGSRWAVWLGDTTVWTVVSLLFIAALAVGWRRRPRLDGTALDLEAIAAAGAVAMRTGRVVPPLDGLMLATPALSSPAPAGFVLAPQRLATVSEAEVEAALDARDRARAEARAAARAARARPEDLTLGAAAGPDPLGADRDDGARAAGPGADAQARMDGAVDEADDGVSRPGAASTDAADIDEGGVPARARVAGAVTRTRPPGRLRRRVDSPDGGPL